MRKVEIKVNIENKISILKFEFEEENAVNTFFECKDFSAIDLLNLYVLLGQCEKNCILTRTMGAWMKTLSLANEEQ